MSRSRRGEELGSAAVFGTSVLGLLLVFTLACAGVAGVLVSHRRAQSAADLGSLAGATAIQHGAAPCPAAAGIVRRNGARLVRCTVAGEMVSVQVEVDTVRVLGVGDRLRAVARAGPVYADVALTPG